MMINRPAGVVLQVHSPQPQPFPFFPNLTILAVAVLTGVGVFLAIRNYISKSSKHGVGGQISNLDETRSLNLPPADQSFICKECRAKVKLNQEYCGNCGRLLEWQNANKPQESQ
jgi:hypothetical protein